MSLKIPYTLVFMPNGAHSPMHIGHLWLLLYARSDYEQMRSATTLFDVRWEVLLDGTFNHYMDGFGADLEYLGWPPDSVQMRSDWQSATELYLGFMHREQCVAGRCGDATALLCRPFYFRERGVRRHFRGEELTEMSYYERYLAQLMGWPYPQIGIVPNLLDPDGAKIGAFGGAAPEYLVGTYRKRGVPGKELIDRLIGHVGEPAVIPSDAGPICPPQGLRLRVPTDWFGGASEGQDQ